MDITGPTLGEADVRKSLTELPSLLDQARYADALVVVRTVKSADGRNIFLIALEKQLEKLTSLGYQEGPPSQQVKELLGSIPALIKRAIEGPQQHATRLPSPETPVQPSLAPRERDTERRAALQSLKSQYVRRAEEYRRKGDYVAALVEVRRVKIVDPSDHAIMEYERKLVELQEVEQRSAGPEEPLPPAVEAPAPPDVSPVPEVEKRMPVMEFGEESGVVPHEFDDAPVSGAEMEGPRSRRPLGFLAVASVAVLVIVGGVYALITSNQSEPSEQQAESASVAKEQGAGPQQTESPAAGHTTETHAAAERDIQKPVMAKKNAETADSRKSRLREPQEEKQKPKQEAQAEQDRPATAPAPQPEIQPLSARDNTMEVEHPAASPDLPAVKGTQSLPGLVHLEKATYPEEAWKNGISGEVIARVQINTKGEPVQVKIVKSTNPIFNEAVVLALMKSTYTAGRMPTGPVITWLNVPFSFKRTGFSP